MASPTINLQSESEDDRITDTLNANSAKSADELKQSKKAKGKKLEFIISISKKLV